MPDLVRSPQIFRALHDAIQQGLVRSCHDLSEGGLAVALAEMAFAGGVGVDVTGLDSRLPEEVALFSESTTRFLVEVRPGEERAFRDHFSNDLPVAAVGRTVKEPRLRLAGQAGEWVVWASLTELEEAWRKPLAW
jgi:phosphoribosylformylglycinamidine synthase